MDVHEFGKENSWAIVLIPGKQLFTESVLEEADKPTGGSDHAHSNHKTNGCVISVLCYNNSIIHSTILNEKV